jgi:uncharacterized protein (TIGR03382 family)
MCRHALALACLTVLGATTARAQCQDGGTALDAGCAPVFKISVDPLPAITGAPLLQIDAIIEDDGSIVPAPGGPGSLVVVQVRGPGSAGGGILVLPDGGSYAYDVPLSAPLQFVGATADAGVTTSIWDGGTQLFLGQNTVSVFAAQPTGRTAESAPQLVLLDLSFDAGSLDAGTDGGTGTDGGVTPDGGAPPDGGASPDAGSPASDAGGGSPTTGGNGGSSEGCSTTGGPPSFFLMALAVMLAALGRRAMRG